MTDALRGSRRARLLLAILAGTLIALACIRDTRNINAVTNAPERVPSGVSAQTWPLCSLIGPRTKGSGVYGTDLGFTVQDPIPPLSGDEADAQLAILFGDTWARAVDGCNYPVFESDDMQGWLPARRPAVLRPGGPQGGEEKACKSLRYPLRNKKELTSWPQIRLFAKADAKRTDKPMDTAGLRTPVTAFSDGLQILTIYSRMDPVYCDRSHACPSGMVCATDPSYRGKRLGECAQKLGIGEDAPSIYCRDGSDCGALIGCNDLERGVCLATQPFTLMAGGTALTPEWYRDDPRRAVAYTMYIAAAVWRERPTDYAVIHRFPTHRFLNVTARTVRHFDPEHPEQNDYRPGSHTLLLWGRSHFVATGGAQLLPFLLYQPLDELRGDNGPSEWKPRFFAGYRADGRPRWSRREADAVPIYGAEAELIRNAPPRIRWSEPEFDYVNQMSVSWVEPLRRWIMLYGGGRSRVLRYGPQQQQGASARSPATSRRRDSSTNRDTSLGARHARSAGARGLELSGARLDARGRRSVSRLRGRGQGGAARLFGRR